MREIIFGVGILITIIIVIVVIMSKEKYIYPSSSGLQYNNTLTSDGYSLNVNNSQFSNSLVSDGVGNISTTSAVPNGFIGMWAGTIATIPSGWALCDGTNGTPDLRSRFIIGASTNQFNSTNPSGLLSYPEYSVGGEEYHALTIEEIPSHAHEAYVGYPDGQGGASIGYSTMDGFSQGVMNIPSVKQTYGPTATVYAGGDPNNQTTTKDKYGNITNETLPHNNLPPFYALAFIMKLN